MNLAQALDQLRTDPGFQAGVAAWRTTPAREAVTAPFPTGLDPRLRAALAADGIRHLYSHQRAAWDAVAAGEHVVVVTPTASGKTLCYNLPVVQRLLGDSDARALFLFPTKALAYDQLNALRGLCARLEAPLRVHTFDGDTPADARRAIRQSGHVVLTNPDMLHTGILPHHTKWTQLFENLRYVIIDEVHQYRGVFGSHLANLLRRLRRLCAFYGTHPQFICCSATIANPQELASKLLGADVTLIDDNGAPRGEKHIILYNPPMVDAALGIRRSVINETQRWADRLLDKGTQLIVFGRSRLRVELLTTYLKESARKRRMPTKCITGYRGGYLPNERRGIEAGLRDGSVRCVVSTNALELGIDIGALDACLMAGYPGSIASTWQQAGRAGRRSSVSLAILLGSSAPVDQFLMQHPDYFFDQPPEHGVIDPNNLIILLSHVKCALFELPFEDGEQFGVDDISELLAYLEELNLVRHVDGRWYWATDGYPAEDVSLRSASPENVVIIDTQNGDRVIGEVDYVAASLEVYEGAIYIHGGATYSVERLDYEDKKAYVKPVDVDYYTDAESKTDIKVLAVFVEAPAERGASGNGEVAVSTLPVAYKKVKFRTHENLGIGRIYLPESQLHTTAFWRDFTPEALEAAHIGPKVIGGALQAVAHVLGQVASIYLMCDPRDVRAVPMVRAPFSERATIYVYDNYPGGVGYSDKLFRLQRMVFEGARDLIQACGCECGCPSCVGPPLIVGEEGKAAALRLIDLVLADGEMPREVPAVGSAAPAVPV